MAIRASELQVVAIVLVASISLVLAVKGSTRINCGEQIKQQPMQYCHMFLSRFETMGVEDEHKQEGSLLQRCCEQLGKLDEGCRCREIRDFVHVQQEDGGWDASRMKRLLVEAPNLPNKCKVGPVLCHI
ncbi:hypothetical protein L6452_00029 [Arctium lappa]|uniref:Uncharacterized protein n=1 Tax=Arctium lappa TaxID=4217 RepID=A0ACB9FDR8_ARCLA|nr:hypothetical protein L6452_00029 [Arctium lappa]